MINTDLPGNSVNTRLLIVLLVASLLRFSGLTAFSLSNDELSALSRLQFDGVSEVIQFGVIPDFHPAGVQLFLYFWTLIFGFGEWAVRFPFALMGVISVYLMYRIGRMWFGESAGLLAAATLAVLEYPLLYSQIARPYSPGLMVCLAATFYWTKALMTKDEFGRYRWIDFLLFALFVSFCMYTHYFSFIFAGILCFSGLFFLRKETILPYITSGFLIVIMYMPHFDVFIHQLSKGGIGGPDGWLGPPESDAFSKYIDYIFNNSISLKTLFFVIFSGTFLLFRKEIKWSKFHLLSLVFFIVPFLIAYFYSIYVNPVFQFSVLIFSFPFLLLLLFSLIPRYNSGFTLTFLLLIVLAGGAYSTVKDKKYYRKQHFTEFRKIALRTIDFNNKLGADNITRTINIFSPYYINYYLEKFGAPCTYELTSIMSEEEKRSFSRVVDNSEKDWFLYSFSNVYDPPELDMVIRSKFPYLAFRDSMMGSGLRLYTRLPIDSALNVLPDFSTANGFESNHWDNELTMADSSVKYEGVFSVLMNDSREYGPTFSKRLFDIKATSGSRIEINVAFKSDSLLSGAKLVFSLDKEGKNIVWSASDASSFGSGGKNWYRVFLVVRLPENLRGDEELKVYVWNEKKEIFYIDDMRLSVYFR